MHVILLIAGVILIAALVLYKPGDRPVTRLRKSLRPGKLPGPEADSPSDNLPAWRDPDAWDEEVDRILEELPILGPLSKEERQAVNDALKARGRLPWMLRDKGMGVATIKGGGLLRETFDYLDRYEAETAIDLRDEKPVFDGGYANQRGREDAFSRALEQHLKEHLPYPFKALAGEGRVDVVTLEAHGNKAYVFIVSKTTDNFMIAVHGGGQFHYDVPKVLRTLEDFIRAHPRMDEVIWLERETNFFMFVVQQRQMG